MEAGPSLAREGRERSEEVRREGVSAEKIRELPSLELVESRLFEETEHSLADRLDAAAKRVSDVSLASVQMLLTAPLWALVALAIKLEDGGPVFFRQERVGRHGERFGGLKFRSMTPREEDDGPAKQAELEEHRVTRVGQFLRDTALDELPQLVNILRGEMSYVGPRPLLPEEREANGGDEPVRLEELPGYEERHSVRPGLTGLAQVHASRSLPHRKKFRYDLLYVRKRTLWLDVRLIARSVWISLTGSWPAVGE